MPHKKVKLICHIDVAPNPKYCGFCVYNGEYCELFGRELKRVEKDCFVRCELCLKNEIK